jgi:hypothetical protein
MWPYWALAGAYAADRQIARYSLLIRRGPTLQEAKARRNSGGFAESLSLEQAVRRQSIKIAC